ncbi:hypothetical protein Ddc_19000 [Ditylenchus destructor]|nr:hypothetical protein Ddc_19000 [Ditylenchus destructor]
MCDTRSTPMAKSGIFRISGSHTSRKNQSLSARPEPIASSHREEAIGISHAQIRVPIGKLPLGQIRISRSHTSRKNQSLSARPEPIASSHREEAIGISHAQIRVPTEKFSLPKPPKS